MVDTLKRNSPRTPVETMADERIERDFLGELRVPRAAYWGVQTQRAIENFRISGQRFGREFLRALGLIKWASAETNMELRLLDPKLGRAISQAARDVADGKLDDQFPLDVFQTGSGTSTHMNANEVIAARANEFLGFPLGTKGPVHPNDHVNICQSSNDVIPTAVHIAAASAIEFRLLPALRDLEAALTTKAREFELIVKTGRTHLMDATPIRLGQEFGGYASQVDHGVRAVNAALPHLLEVALGGTAVGTGINAHPEFARRAIEHLAQATELKLREADNHFEAQGAQDALVEACGALATVAASLMKIANDLRWLGSGPRAGLGELNLPAVQAGSSIMPGKVNPVIPEAVMMVAAQVLGNAATIAMANTHSNLDMSTMVPVMHRNVQESIELLANAAHAFTERCVKGITANSERLRAMAEMSPAIATRLNPIIGYDKAAEIAREAVARGVTVKQLVVEKGILSKEEADRLLDPAHLTKPSKDLLGSGGG